MSEGLDNVRPSVTQPLQVRKTRSKAVLALSTINSATPVGKQSKYSSKRMRSSGRLNNENVAPRKPNSSRISIHTIESPGPSKAFNKDDLDYKTKRRNEDCSVSRVSDIDFIASSLQRSIAKPIAGLVPVEKASMRRRVLSKIGLLEQPARDATEASIGMTKSAHLSSERPKQITQDQGIQRSRSENYALHHQMRPTPVKLESHATCATPIHDFLHLHVRMSCNPCQSSADTNTEYMVNIEAVATDGHNYGERFCDAVKQAELHNLTLRIHPASGSTILDLEGPTSATTLGPHQALRISARVNQSSLDDFTTVSTEDDERSTAICVDLEKELGDVLTDLLHVEAHYSHSKMPQTTTLLFRDTCRVHRLTTSSTSAAKAMGISRQPEKHPDLDHRLPPVHVVTNVASEDQGEPERLTLAPLRVVKKITLESEDCVLDQWQASNQSHTLRHHERTDSGDEARKIWRDMRRDSMSLTELESELEQSIDLQAETETVVEEGVAELRRTAVANKRSIGAETLAEWGRETCTGVKRVSLPIGPRESLVPFL